MDDPTVFLAACGVVAYVLLRRARRRRRNRTVWVRDWIRSRPRHGAFHSLVQELRLGDEAALKNFLRMNSATFEELLGIVGPHITYQDTHLRQAIPAGERLALTLRFLASGEQNNIINASIAFYF